MYMNGVVDDQVGGGERCMMLDFTCSYILPPTQMVATGDLTECGAIQSTAWH
jgi:hypothetical protein